jgi:hypothetical protein
MEEGKKFDGGKLRYDLLPFDSLDELVKVYTHGAEKYEDRNWETGIRYSRILAAMLRHVTAWAMGERNDPDTGLHHLAHAAWGCFAIIAYQRRSMIAFDDMKQGENGGHTVLKSD